MTADLFWRRWLAQILGEGQQTFLQNLDGQDVYPFFVPSGLAERLQWAHDLYRIPFDQMILKMCTGYLRVLEHHVTSGSRLMLVAPDRLSWKEVVLLRKDNSNPLSPDTPGSHTSSVRLERQVGSDRIQLLSIQPDFAKRLRWAADACALTYDESLTRGAFVALYALQVCEEQDYTVEISHTGRASEQLFFL